MRGLNQLRQAVIAALTEGGLRAVPAYEGAALRYTGTVIAVDVAEGTGRPMAMGDYLGQSYDEQAGTVTERYGCSLDFSLSLEVRAPAAADCESGCEAAADVLLGSGLPSGIHLKEQFWEGVVWDTRTQMFLRKGCVRGSACFVAQTDPETETLHDFTLKGVLNT